MSLYVRRNGSGLYHLTLDERGIPCLDGERLAGVRSYTLEADDLGVATLTISLYVTLDPEVGFDSCGDDVGSDGR